MTDLCLKIDRKKVEEEEDIKRVRVFAMQVAFTLFVKILSKGCAVWHLTSSKCFCKFLLLSLYKPERYIERTLIASQYRKMIRESTHPLKTQKNLCTPLFLISGDFLTTEPSDRW